MNNAPQDLDFAKILLTFMTEQKLTQKELANKIGVTDAALGKWLNHSRGITRKNIEAIKRVCASTISRMEGNAIAMGDGSAASVHGNATAAPVTVSNESIIAQTLDALRDRILDDDEICDACKVRVMKHLSTGRK